MSRTVTYNMAERWEWTITIPLPDTLALPEDESEREAVVDEFCRDHWRTYAPDISSLDLNDGTAGRGVCDDAVLEINDYPPGDPPLVQAVRKARELGHGD